MVYMKYMPFHSMKNASRNWRELLVVCEQGYEACIFSDDKNGEIYIPNNMSLINDGVVKSTYSMHRFQRYLLIVRNFLIVFVKTCMLKADVFSCHDLYALVIAYLATSLRVRRPRLIYDSHEFELGRNAKRSKRQIDRIKKWEGFLIHKCAFTIVVNETIADELVCIYKPQIKPIVVRSTPNRWVIDNEVCNANRKAILHMFSNQHNKQEGARE